MTNGIIQQNVVYKTEKGTPVTDSLKVAQVFGKLHKNVMKSIRGLAQNLADRFTEMFDKIAFENKTYRK